MNWLGALSKQYWTWFHVCLPPSLVMTWQRHSTEVKPTWLLCTRCCWPEVQEEGRSLLCKSAKPLYTSVSFLVSTEMFIIVYSCTGQKQQQSQRFPLFVISTDQMNHCRASSDHFCFITPCSFHYKNPALSKLFCLFLVLAFHLIKCDFHRKTGILICPWGQLTSCHRLCPAQHFLGTSNRFVDGLFEKTPLIYPVHWFILTDCFIFLQKQNSSGKFIKPNPVCLMPSLKLP